MNAIPAKELKRRGVVALEEVLKKGPLQIIKRNKPTCVVLSVADFEHLTAQKSAPSESLWSWTKKPATGKQSRQSIDKQVRAERTSWDKR